MWRNDIESFYRFCVSGKHGSNNMVDNLDLSLVCRSDFDEDVFSIQGNLAVVTVDDGR